MTVESDTTRLTVGKWQLLPDSGELIHEQLAVRLEPKVVELLLLLAERQGQVVTREDIVNRLWPNTVVGDDTLARTVSKLRKALGDDGKAQDYIETLSKRGYRLVASVSRTEPVNSISDQRENDPPAIKKRLGSRAALVTLAALLSTAVLIGAWYRIYQNRNSTEEATETAAVRANDFYFQYSRPGNESAIALFEQLIATKPDYAPGYAGLANALVQKVVRWQNPPGNHSADDAQAGSTQANFTQADYTNLGDAIRNGHTRTPAARQILIRAQQLAEQAVALAPENAEAHKALGFVYSAREQYDLALAAYQRAVSADNNAWGALINMGDVLEISGRPSEALPYFEAAHAAMTRVYSQQKARILPWYAALGVVIGDRYQSRGDPQKAEQWYRRVLDYAPLDPEATRQMATLRRQAGDNAGADALCKELAQRIGSQETCPLSDTP